MYEIRFLPAAEKYFKKIKEKPLKVAFLKAIETIRDNPYLGVTKRGDLAGIYEIAYTIYEQDNKLVVVLLAGTRENFYDQLKRYIH
jgi:mRNA interferase RelE/StbE